jgi:predicted nicotinamide N-methyase
LRNVKWRAATQIEREIETMSDRQIERMKEMAWRYPLADISVRTAGRSWQITAVQDQDALIAGVETDEDLANFPYGLMLWASALGLAEWLSRTPSLVRGKRVLEIGAGVGLAGLAASALGAVVIQTDFQADALTLCRHNAARNAVEGIRIARRADWRDFPADLRDFDVVIGSDVLYERASHGLLNVLLPRIVVPGGCVLLSDPLRPQALEFVERLEARGRWNVTMGGLTVPWDGGGKDIALFDLKKR